MKVDKEEILHIAKLADLNIEDNELEKYQSNLQEILNFADMINNIDTEGISESISMIGNKNVFREDKIVKFEGMDLLANASDKENNMFKIPKVI